MSGGVRAGFAAVGLVMLGFALGVFADHLWLAYRMHHVQMEPTHEESLVAMLASLDLSKDQHDAIEQIIGRYHDTVEERLSTVHPELLATMDSARQEIETQLDSNQVMAFRDWMHGEHSRLQPTQHSIIGR